MKKLWQWRYVFMGYIWRNQQMNRITDVECDLRKMAAGKMLLPTKEECLDLAIRVGTPKEHWPERLKKV